MGWYILDDNHLIASCDGGPKRILEVSANKQSLTVTQSFTFGGKNARTVHSNTNTYIDNEEYKVILSPTTAGPNSILAGIPASHTISSASCIQDTVYCYWLMEETATSKYKLVKADITSPTLPIEEYSSLLTDFFRECENIFKGTPYLVCTSQRRVIIDTSYTTGNYEILENRTGMGG